MTRNKLDHMKTVNLLSEKKYFIAAAAVFLASFGLFLNTLTNEFVYDDVSQVLSNRWITDIKYIPDIFQKGVWEFESASPQNYYRPLMHIVYMICFHVFGFAPWGYHLVNIVLHSGVSVLVFLLISQFLRDSAPQERLSVSVPLTAAMLFASHPIHTEVVAWVACIPELSYTFFLLLSFYLYTQATGREHEIRRVKVFALSVASFLFAVFSKEPAIILPILLIAYDFLLKGRPADLARYLKRYSFFLAALTLYLGMRMSALGGFAPNHRHATLSAFDCFINIFPLFSDYIGKLLLPINLNAFYEYSPITSLLNARGILSLLVAGVFAALAFYSFRRNRPAFLAVLIMLLPLLPVLYIPTLAENIFTERYLYLPSFGFVMLPALMVNWATTSRPRTAAVFIATITVAVIAYSIGTFQRNAIWKDNYTLFADTLKKSPDSTVPHSYFGFACLQEGLVDEAIRHFELVLRKRPYLADMHSNLGKAYREKGMYDKAIEHYKTALSLEPDSSDAPGFHNNLGNAYSEKGLLSMAVTEYIMALKLDPESATAYNNLGIAYGEMGRSEEAIKYFQAALRFKPDDPNVHQNIAHAYKMKGLAGMAEQHLAKAGELSRR